METTELYIPGMQSAHCQGRVTGAIADISGIQIKRLQPGRLMVSFESDEIKIQLVAAIEKAGYRIEAGVE